MKLFFKTTVFLFFITFIGLRFLWAEMPKPTVRVTSAEEHIVQDRYRVIGTLHPVSRSEIAAREDGAVIEVKVNEGQMVKKGEVLAVLDARRIQASLKEAQAQLSMAQSMIRQREVELSRAEVDNTMKKQLYDDKAIAERVFLDAEREFRVAETQLQSSKDGVTEAESRLELLRVRLEDMEIRAPFDGTILAKHIETGEWVMPGNALFTMMNSGNIEAWLDVPERLSEDVAKYANEITVDITATHDKITSTSLRSIPEIDSRARTFKLIATLENQDHRLAPGMSVTTWIPTSSREKRLLVSKNAILQRQGDVYLFKIVGSENEGYRAQQIPITVLFELGANVAIKTEALAAGDYIIIEGNERLMSETPVDISISKEKTA